MARPAIFRNIGSKLLALAIALLVWFVLSAQRRERISERTYRIPLSVVNIPPQTLIASPLPAAVDVRVRGPFTALRQIDPEKLEAVVDLTDAPKGERIFRLAPEDINVPPEVEVIAIAPSELRIVLDATAQKTLPIVPNVTGKPAPGYEVADVVVEPRVAYVYGPASALERLANVTTDPISIDQRAASFSVPATVLADAPGIRIRQGQIVTVTVHLRSVPELQATPAMTGRPKRK
jgi:YbbR domain-containing protein